jgi:putative heme-binding domain-containing protein
LLWWAVEDKAIRDRDRVLDLLAAPDDWKVPLIRQVIVERLGRRYMAEGGEADLETCAKLLAAAPGPDEVQLLVRGMEKALEGRQLPKVPAALEKGLANLWEKQGNSALLVRFAMRLGSPQGYERALALAGDAKVPEADRIGLIEALGQAGKPDCLPVLLRLLAEGKGDNLRGAALSALQPFADDKVTRAVLDAYPKLSGSLRGRAQTLLCSRPVSALAFLQAVDGGKIDPKEVPLDTLRRVVSYKDERLTKIIEKHWGKVGPLPAGEKVARINAIRHALGQKPGDKVNGKALFTKTCATCHTLFGEGNKVGPELTAADRKNRDFLLVSIVDPSASIRPEYVAYVVNLKDGRTLTGLVVESSPKAVTLLNEKNERTVIARDKIDDMSASPVSLMPEKVLDPLSEQEIRDLFAYLQSDGSGK